MQLGETIATYDPDLALRGETGKFEIKSPNGDTHYVTCRNNGVVAKPEKSANEIYPGAFFIRKIAEMVAAEKNDTNSARRGDNPMLGNSPFLLESKQDAGALTTIANSDAEIADYAKRDELCRLDLSYSASESKPEEPRAFVYVNTGHKQLSGAGPRLLLTAECASYTELDAEIRKLQAELDEICLRAKKNFYKARAAAASA